MSYFKDFYNKLKNKVFGIADPDEIKPRPRRRLDQGPAEQWYVKACFARSIFTKKMTPCREKYIRNTMKWLRPEQREIAIRLGYTKGVKL